MRELFDEQLTLLNHSLIEMGGAIEYAISTAVEALVKQDIKLADTAIAYDHKIDDKEKEIEQLCMDLLLLQHPIAGDLRLVSAALKMITDMERIGDQSADISEIAKLLANSQYIHKLDQLVQMAGAAIKMVKDAIDAFVQRDIALANAVVAYDDVVDDYFIAVREALVRLIKEDVENCRQAFDLMMIAKYLERIGDHAVNIAEWVVYSLTGTHNCAMLE